MPSAKYPNAKHKEKLLYKTFSSLPRQAIDRARQLYMLYIPPDKILELLKVEYPGVVSNIGIKSFNAYTAKRQWRKMRERLEKRVVENVRYKGYETAVAITVQTAELLKRGLLHLNSEGAVLGVRDMDRISTIYERFDKIMRLEQSLPTEIIQGQLTKDKVALLLKDIDYLDGLDDIAQISERQSDLAKIEDEHEEHSGASGEEIPNNDFDVASIVERHRLGNTDDELDVVLELEKPIED